MRTTITIDDALFEAAAACCEGNAPSAVVSKACQTLVEVESARRLMRLSASAPDFSIPDRSQRGSEVARVAEPDSGYGSA